MSILALQQVLKPYSLVKCAVGPPSELLLMTPTVEDAGATFKPGFNIT